MGFTSFDNGMKKQPSVLTKKYRSHDIADNVKENDVHASMGQKSVSIWFWRARWLPTMTRNCHGSGWPDSYQQ